MNKKINAKDLLRLKIKTKDKHVGALKIILDKFPWDELTSEEEELLW